MSSIAATMSSKGFNHFHHVEHLFDAYVFYPFFNELNQVAKRSSIVAWLSPVIGITVGTAQFIRMIGTVFEAGIKGITNLAVGLTTFNTSLLGKGALQLLFIVPLFGVASIPVLIFITLMTMTRIFFDPEGASKEKAESFQSSIDRFSQEEGITGR